MEVSRFFGSNCDRQNVCANIAGASKILAMQVWSQTKQALSRNEKELTIVSHALFYLEVFASKMN
jgi:hypothetical protein